MMAADHPAESPEFLSRLHDRELDPAEASAFEVHRARCPACRAAVADFERALSAYREAPVAPVGSDLSVRILRKIRATSPARRPFGVTFGIDFRWAGLLAAALLLVIIGAPVFSRRAAAPAPAASGPAAPISAYLVDSDEVRSAGRAQAPPPPKKSAAEPAPAPSSGPSDNRPAARKDAPEAYAASPAHERANAAAAPAVVAEVPAAPPQALDKSLRARREAASAAPAAGATADSAAPPAPVRLTIRAADGEEPAPELLREPSHGSLVAMRGREFTVTVDSDGHVVAVDEPEEKGKLSRERIGAAQAMPGPPDAAEVALRDLVFRAGDRTRRLTVAVE